MINRIKLAQLIFSLILLIVMCILLKSCTPAQRMGKLITKHPELIKKDSVLIKDSLLIKGKHAVFNFDTSIYNYNSISNGIEIRYVKRNGVETISANTSDTIIKKYYYNYTNNYTTEKHLTIAEKIKEFFVYFGIVILAIIIIFIVVKFLKL